MQLNVELALSFTYNSNADQANAVTDTINNNGGKAVALQLDSSKAGSFIDFAAQVSQVLKEEWNRDNFDYLVNNAGIAQRTLIQDTTDAFGTSLIFNPYSKSVNE